MKYKKKLMAATMSLVIATVMLGSSSYAWFTISTSPEVTGIATQITANENIEIALDNGYEDAEDIDAVSGLVGDVGTAGNPYTWGNLLDLSTALSNMEEELSLRPVAYTTEVDGSETVVVMQTPKFAVDGRIEELFPMERKYISAYSGVETPAGGFSVFTEDEDSDFADALAFAFWLRANDDVKLQLSEGTYRADDGTNESGTVNAEQGAGSSLVFTLPDAFDKANAIMDDVDDDAEDCFEAFRDYILLLDGDATERAAKKTAWTTAYTHLQGLFQTNLSGNPVIYEIQFRQKNADSGYAMYYFTFDELNLLMEKTVTELKASSAWTYLKLIKSDSVLDYVTRLRPSDELVGLLEKIRIRFNLDGEDGLCLTAKIVPYTEILQKAEEDYLADEYYDFESSGVKFDEEPQKCAQFYTIERESQWTAGSDSFKFQLKFYNHTSDPSNYEDYIEAKEIQASIENLITEKRDTIMEQVITPQVSEPDATKKAIAAIEGYIKFLEEKISEKILTIEKAFQGINLSKNTALKVSAYMYLDGTIATNADAITLDGANLALNLQFEKIGGAKNAMTGSLSTGE